MRDRNINEYEVVHAISEKAKKFQAEERSMIEKDKKKHEILTKPSSRDVRNYVQEAEEELMGEINKDHYLNEPRVSGDEDDD